MKLVWGRLKEEKNKGEESSSDDKVTVQNNHLFFYEDVNEKSILALNKNLRAIEFEIKKNEMIYNFGNYKPEIYIHINSLGGYVTDGFGAVDIIR